jgi:hypothetical protein
MVLKGTEVDEIKRGEKSKTRSHRKLEMSDVLYSFEGKGTVRFDGL